MKAKPSLWKNRLVKTTTFMTVILVAALFISSAAFAAITPSMTATELNNTVTDSRDGASTIPDELRGRPQQIPAPLRATILSEGFEGGVVPPAGWSRIQTNTGVNGGHSCYWDVNTDPLYLHTGTYSAGLWWSYDHQDEWLISPQMDLTGYAAAQVTFWTYGWEGSVYDDHYYVKVSTDNGTTWTVLLDLSDLTGDDWNAWDYPYVVDLTAYIGQTIKLAWHAIDCNDPSNPNYPGLWYVWFIDDIEVTGSMPGESDMAVTDIICPADGEVMVINPVVEVENQGTVDETNVPVTVNISKLAYTVLLEEHFDSGVFPPAGWTITHSNWQISSTNYAGGVSPEARLYYSPSSIDTFRMYTGPIDTTGYTNLALRWKHYLSHFATPYTLKVETSTDGVTWGAVWSMDPTGDIPASEMLLPLTTANGVGSSTFRFSFTLVGDIWNINWWHIDDVMLFISGMTQEYTSTEYININAGDTQVVTFATAWTPADLQVSENVYIDYLVEASVSVPGDTDPTNDMLTDVVTLHYGYFHDVGVDEIVKPADGYAEKITPEVLITNYGQYDETVTANMVIEKAAYTLYLEEHFEDPFPPAGWTTAILQGTNGWLRNDGYARPNYAGGDGYCADADSDAVGSGGPWPMECALISPSMNLSTVTGAIFSFMTAYNDITTGAATDYANVEISIDGGTTWTVLLHWDEDHSASGPGEEAQVDISPYCGNADVKIRFVYYAPGWDWYWEVDDVKVFEVAFITEYDEDVVMDVAVGATETFIYPDWTPSDITMSFDLDYRVTVNASLGGFTTLGLEDFESYVPGYYPWPTGWTEVVTNTNSNWFIYETSSRARCQESGALGLAQDEWLMSPTIDLTGMSTVQFSYYRYFYASTTSGDSQVELLGSIDDGATWSTVMQTYTATASSGTETFDISSWAANQPTVKFAWHFTSTADTGEYDYFYFDDLFIGTIWGPFGDNPPAGWTILDYGSTSPPVWDLDDWHRYASTSYPAQGQFARVYYVSPYENREEWLITPAIDCTALSNVTLELWQYFYYYSTNPGYGYIDGSIDGGATWPYSIASYSATQSSGIYTFDISSWAAGYGNVTIRFRYNSTLPSQGRYWYVDDVTFKDGTTVIYTQNFEGVAQYATSFDTTYVPEYWGPNNWQEVIVTGTDVDNDWDGSNGASTHPTGVLPVSGTWMAQYDSFSISSGNSNRLYLPTPIDFTSIGSSAYRLKFWMHHDTGYSGNDDHVEIQVSLDGVNWTTIDSVSRYRTSTYWEEHIVDLSAYALETTVYLGFLGVSFFGNSIYMDDMAFQAYGSVVDGDLTNNEVVQWVTLTYIHDTGVSAITEPTYPYVKGEGDIIFHQRPFTPTESWTFRTSAAGAGYVCQDDFWALTEPIGDIEFWGLALIYSAGWTQGNPAGMEFEIIFYENGGTAPGAPVATFSGLTPTAVNTGLLYSGFSMFYWALDLPEDVELADGWVSIQSTACPDGSWLLWAGSPEGNLNMWQQGGSPPQIAGDSAFNLSAGASGPGGNWPPGTYGVAGIAKNFGSFTETNILVNAKIWKQDTKADILYYEENVTVATLAPGAEAPVTFPDVTFTDPDEGYFKLEMRTMLPGDDRPSNDKKTFNFVIQAPDVTPPVTTAELTGTMGLDDWYVSTVTVTLTAVDPPAGFTRGMGKWPTGVNHTYYKIDTGAWEEYTVPFEVTGDGQHTVYFYSDDNAGNVESEKSISFKMDTTVPTITLTATAQNILKTKWLLEATVSDATSGVVKVEFYIDDAYVGEATAAPWEYLYQGRGKVAQAIAYDAAGNSAMSDPVDSLGITELNTQVNTLPAMQTTLQ